MNTPKYEVGDIIVDKYIEHKQLNLKGMFKDNDRTILIVGIRAAKDRRTEGFVEKYYEGMVLETGELLLDMIVESWDSASNVSKVA